MSDSDDDLFVRACSLVREEQRASNNFLQARLGVGTGRARKLLARMEAVGLISAADEQGNRTITNRGGQPMNDETQKPEAEALPPGHPDHLYQSAVTAVRAHGKAGVSFVQRTISVGYNEAARMIERMEAEGVVSKPDHLGKRAVLPAGGRPASQIPDNLHPTDVQEERESADEVLARPHNIMSPGNNMVSGDELRAYFEKVERVRNDKTALAEVEKGIFAELKSRGFNAAIVRNVLKMRAQTPSAREEQIAITELYLAAIGMASEPPMMRMMAGMGVDPAVKESVVAALKMIVPQDGEIILRVGPVRLRFARTREGVVVDDEPLPGVVEAASAGPDLHIVKDDLAGLDEAEARAMGQTARLGDIPIVRNPFPYGDPNRQAWDEGWRDEDGGSGFGDR